jgi:hypothetical protein
MAGQSVGDEFERRRRFEPLQPTLDHGHIVTVQLNQCDIATKLQRCFPGSARPAERIEHHACGDRGIALARWLSSDCLLYLRVAETAGTIVEVVRATLYQLQTYISASIRTVASGFAIFPG